MSDASLIIAASALAAQQSAMDTVAQNLANVNTPAYRSEQPQLTTAPGGAVGAGVWMAGVDQAGSALLTAGARAASAAAAQMQATSTVLSGVTAAFPEPSSTGLAAQLATFWSAWDGIGNAPSQPAPRTQVVDLAQNLVTTLHSASAQIASAQGQATAELARLTASVNTALSRVATLNTSIVAAATAGESTGALVDQRAGVLDVLSKDLGATVSAEPSGAVDVLVGGVRLVQGAQVMPVTLSIPGPSAAALSASGVGLAVGSGTAAGLLGVVNQTLPGLASELDAVATGLATTVNSALANGYDAAGQSGSANPLFLLGTPAAASISVNPTVAANPSLLAASGSPSAPGDGSNAAAIAELGASSSGPDALYRSFVADLGSQAAAAASGLAAGQALQATTQQAEQGVSGVHSDQQMVSMLAYQHAYQAAAKLVATSDAMVQSLLAVV